MNQTVSRCRKVMLVALAGLFLFIGAQSSAQAEYLGETDVKSLQKMIAESKGTPVLVSFWASWCPPCRREVPVLKSLRDELTEEQLKIVSISLDQSRDDAKKFVAEQKMNYPAYAGGMDFVEEYEISGIPRVLIFDAKGKLAADHTGFSTEEDFRASVMKHVQGASK
ncbi:TlpA family protein disulfide reductase [Desulfobaculum bizertense]|uniref:Thiol-disulfide isomerase or thioredoxin n=1 Tax=Desulfobaculum bizertense DSM 18034 TaxID=1121442 RepID=A0A1T4VXP8_9BACT|nr:TlpA disulfide reductase family protein [Desulfobaculum bizertense]UIJ36958.1 TlpA family protein disulfide reductase [Desulfobaculum bizertense]SKA69776.1 Thiol-disulfide isomerase or thioredoxin [Desulfobaculum bizertense DSM 18034]